MSRRIFILITATLWATAGGCVEKRVVAVRGNLQSLSGASGGYELGADADRPPSKDFESALAKSDESAGRSAPGEPIEGRPLRRMMPDGSVLLISRSPRHVMIHLFETLRDEEDELLLNQVISNRLREEYEERGKDPAMIVRELRRERQEIVKLMTAMPMAEQTPGALMRTTGRNVFEVTAPGGPALDQKFKRLSVVIEKGSFRLLSIS